MTVVGRRILLLPLPQKKTVDWKTLRNREKCGFSKDVKMKKVTVVTVFGWAGKKLTLLPLSQRSKAFVGGVTACVAMRNRIGGCDRQRNKRAT